MEQNVTPSPDQVPDVGHGVGQQVDSDRAAPVHHKFWVVVFVVAAMAVLSWFLMREMANAWEHRGHSLSPAPAGLVL
jgi:hypothetical protein